MLGKSKISIQNPPKLVRNRKGGIFLIFVTISTIIWFLNNLNETHSTTINIPVKIVNVPVNTKINQQIVENLDITVSGKGFHLAGMHLNKNRDSLIIDVGEMTAGSNNSGRYAYPTLNLISKSWKKTRKVLPVTVDPDSLVIDLSPRSSLMIPIHSNIHISTDKPFGITGGVVLEPDSVLVIGPASELEKIKAIETEEINHDQLQEEVFDAVHLKNPSPSQLTLSLPYTYYYANIVEYTEQSFNMPVIIPMSQSPFITLLPSEVTITFSVPIEHYSNITSKDFKLTTSLLAADTLPTHLEVKLIKAPLHIRNLRIEPQLLDYLIKTESK